MKYPVLLQDSAIRLLDDRRGEAEVGLEEYIQFRGEGQPIDETAFEVLHLRLKELRDRYPQRLRQRDPHGAGFDSEACSIVHQEIHFPLDVLADLDFWTYVSAGKLSDLVEWRHGEDGRPAALANYGIGNRMENLVFRLWMRAEVVFDGNAEDPYSLCRRGDIDLWRSHILRKKYANCRNMAKALIRFQYPDEHPERPTLTGLAIRDLAKRLRKLHSNLLFSALDYKRAKEMLEREASFVNLT